MLGKGIDTTPSGNEQAVEEFLTSSRSLQPDLPYQEEDSEDDSVANERTTHDEMRQTLTQMITAAESQRRNASKQHLHPASDGHCLPHHSVHHDRVPPYPGMDSFF